MSSNRNSSARNAMKQKLFGGRKMAKCCFCKCELTFSRATLEHVIPVAEGGRHGLDNMRLSCSTCNLERGIEDFETYRAKFKKKEVV